VSRELGPGSAPTPTLSARLGVKETTIEVGAIHPGVRRTLVGAGSSLGFLVTLDDEQITDLEVEIGLGHRGFEKEVESASWLRALPYVSRLGFGAGLVAGVAYCSGLEKLAQLELPERAIWLRTLACELSRVGDHLARLAGLWAAVELPAAETLAQEAALEAGRLLETATGCAPLAVWAHPGGVANDLSEGFDEHWADGARTLEACLARLDRVGVRNPTCIRRLRGVAPLDARGCLAWSVTGPALRAAGQARDRRRDAPYLGYAELDFDVPIGEEGDDYDRLLVVFEEIRQSLEIVEQCRTRLAACGPGPVANADAGWRWPVGAGFDAGSGAGDAASTEPRVPEGEAWVSLEAPTGELGFLLVSDGEGLPRRIRCRAPSFFHAQALPAMLRGAQLDDLLPTAALLHLVSGECDR
jgi:NADH-quinone oxidoreductase subunit D